VTDDLRIFLSPEVMNRIFTEAADYYGNLSLNMIRKGIFPDSNPEIDSFNVDDGLNIIKEAMKKNGLNPKQFYQMFDINSKGSIVYDDFLKTVTHINPRFTPPQVAKIFKRIDFNGNGVLSQSEFFAVFQDENVRAD
jgi:hypothetical protein